MKTLHSLFVALMLFSAFSPVALAAPANGIWVTSTGDYFLLMTDSAKGQAVAVQVASDLGAASAYVGSVAGETLALKKLDQGSTLTATANGTTLSGSYVQSASGASDVFSANLNYTYVGSIYDGAWQKTDGTAYLAYLTVMFQGKPVSMVVDLTVFPDNTVSYDLIIGEAANNVFSGVSALNGKVLRITFSGTTASGTYSTATRQVAKFTAAQIFKIN
ncbi:MAG: hypothetical protein KGZ83_18990 [Sulfuricella sp.]|nr:hypothetical protein [Sulfuricella sp.]